MGKSKAEYRVIKLQVEGKRFAIIDRAGNVIDDANGHGFRSEKAARNKLMERLEHERVTALKNKIAVIRGKVSATEDSEGSLQ